MKRDLNLFRKLVLIAEDTKRGVTKLYAEGYSQSQVGFHAHLVVEAGLAKGVDMTIHGNDGPQAVITSLTWAGHEFADLVRDDDRWNNALSTMTQGGQVSFQALKRLLASATRPPAPDVFQSLASEANTIQSSKVEKASQRAGAKRGPKPDRATAQRVVKIIESVASADEWKTKLADVCQALDSNEIPHPSPWPRRDLEMRSWSDAAALEPQLAIKAIEYRIEIAKA